MSTGLRRRRRASPAKRLGRHPLARLVDQQLELVAGQRLGQRPPRAAATSSSTMASEAPVHPDQPVDRLGNEPAVPTGELPVRAERPGDDVAGIAPLGARLGGDLQGQGPRAYLADGSRS